MNGLWIHFTPSIMQVSKLNFGLDVIHLLCHQEWGKLKNYGRMIDYVYGIEPSKIWWRNLWTAPKIGNSSHESPKTLRIIS